MKNYKRGQGFTNYQCLNVKNIVIQWENVLFHSTRPMEFEFVNRSTYYVSSGLGTGKSRYSSRFIIIYISCHQCFIFLPSLRLHCNSVHLICSLFFLVDVSLEVQWVEKYILFKTELKLLSFVSSCFLCLVCLLWCLFICWIVLVVVVYLVYKWSGNVTSITHSAITSSSKHFSLRKQWCSSSAIPKGSTIGQKSAFHCETVEMETARLKGEN